MKPAVILFVILVAQYGAAAQRTESAVVKVYCTSAPVTTYQPWIPDQPVAVTGTGFVIAGRRILTNAHVVDFATFIQVKKRERRAATRHPSRTSPMTRTWRFSPSTIRRFFTA
ncbi:MAG: hypothetical protein QHI48_06175 [Bacteroidota bacterium]|nr:hypothetical protein [Bacteroidota bacterium]